MKFNVDEERPTIIFGSYHGMLEWRVLDEDDKKMIVITKDIIDAQPFHKYTHGAPWSQCTLRKWLKKVFYNEAFSDAEKELIIPQTLKQETVKELYCPDAVIKRDVEVYTNDEVFLLSSHEVGKYFFGPPTEAEGTDYAKQQGLYVVPETEDNIYLRRVGKSPWWTRTSYQYYSHPVAVDVYGNMHEVDYWKSKYGVRPALWLDKAKAPWLDKIKMRSCYGK